MYLHTGCVIHICLLCPPFFWIVGSSLWSSLLYIHWVILWKLFPWYHQYCILTLLCWMFWDFPLYSFFYRCVWFIFIYCGRFDICDYLVWFFCGKNSIFLSEFCYVYFIVVHNSVNYWGVLHCLLLNYCSTNAVDNDMSKDIIQCLVLFFLSCGGNHLSSIPLRFLEVFIVVLLCLIINVFVV